MYKNYLSTKSQLAESHAAHLLVKGQEIRIQPNNANWRLTTKLFNTPPKELASVKKLNWESDSIYLEEKPDGIYLIQEVPAITEFIPFKRALSAFSQLITFWQDLFA